MAYCAMKSDEVLPTSIGDVSVQKREDDPPFLCLNGVVQVGHSIFSLEGQALIQLRNKNKHLLTHSFNSNIYLSLDDEILFIPPRHYIAPEEADTSLKKIVVALQNFYLDRGDKDENCELFEAVEAELIDNIEVSSLDQENFFRKLDPSLEAQEYLESLKIVRQAIKDDIFPQPLPKTDVSLTYSY